MRATETLAAGIFVAATGGPLAFAIARAWLGFHRRQRALAQAVEEAIAKTTSAGATSKTQGPGVAGSR